MSERGRVEHFNPEELLRIPAFTQVEALRGPVTIVMVGGQNGCHGLGGDCVRAPGVSVCCLLPANRQVRWSEGAR